MQRECEEIRREARKTQRRHRTTVVGNGARSKTKTHHIADIPQERYTQVTTSQRYLRKCLVHVLDMEHEAGKLDENEPLQMAQKKEVHVCGKGSRRCQPEIRLGTGVSL